MMSVEQIARDFINSMNNPNAAESYLTPDAVAAGGILPQPIPAKEAIRLMSSLNTAFPDLKFDIQNVTVNGDQATVQAVWSGTNNGDLNMPGMPSVSATGKQVSVKDTYIPAFCKARDGKNSMGKFIFSILPAMFRVLVCF
jgi:predicted ester cyclase